MAQKHPGIAREGLHVAPLSLGVDRVEGEARLARAREARDHDKLVARDADVYVAQVVLARSADDDGFRCHGYLSVRSDSPRHAKGPAATCHEVSPSRWFLGT